MNAPAPIGTQQAFSAVRGAGAYDRVRLPVQRLIAALEAECRDREADALRDLLAHHQAQRIQLVDCHQRFRAMHSRLQIGLAMDQIAETVGAA